MKLTVTITNTIEWYPDQGSADLPEVIEYVCEDIPNFIHGAQWTVEEVTE